MVREDLTHWHRCGRGLSSRLRRLTPLGERIGTSRELGSMRRIHLAQSIRDRTRDDRPIFRIEPVVRVPAWMHVPHRCVYPPGRFLQRLDSLRAIDDSNRGIVRAVQNRLSPSIEPEPDFE